MLFWIEIKSNQSNSNRRRNIGILPFFSGHHWIQILLRLVSVQDSTFSDGDGELWNYRRKNKMKNAEMNSNLCFLILLQFHLRIQLQSKSEVMQLPLDQARASNSTPKTSVKWHTQRKNPGFVTAHQHLLSPPNSCFLKSAFA